VKIFVTGGSGFVGGEILRQLHEDGHTIRVLARNPKTQHSRTIASRHGAELFPGDILNIESLKAGARDCDAIVHLVGIISEVGANTFENVHAVGTQNVITAAQSAGVKRFIHMSALGTRPNATSRYHQSKWTAEESLRQSGLDFTIFRPSIIYGPGDHFVNLFAKIARFSPVLPVMGNGNAKMQPVAVADVATCFVRAIAEPKSIGQTYDLCGPDALSFDEILDAILEVMGKKRIKLHLPMGLARFQASLLEIIFPLFGKAPPLNRDQLLMLREDNVGDPGPAEELFHLQPESFKRGIATYLAHKH
jgi:NADH dehydrogenase